MKIKRGWLLAVGLWLISGGWGGNPDDERSSKNRKLEIVQLEPNIFLLPATEKTHNT
ncbi:hypothetical protein [Salinimicrobium sp. HB62]|uniref:hypothetical protein n=1 Tax=Salinimicrobium sp. HB62 TaxID=3077781 RepID=UPI002D78CAF4|nr:hypothetical protein [Salinimicrobium sp. HB62]